MNKNLKRASALGMSLIMMFSLAGCSKENKKEEKKTVSGSEYGYNVEYVELKNKVQNMGSPKLIGNTLYFTNYKWDENTSSSSTMIQCIDISSPDEIKTCVKYEDDANHNTDIFFFYPDSDGNITLLKTVYTFDPSDTEEGDSPDGLGDIPGDAAITEEYLQQLNIDLSSVGLAFSDISDMTVSEVVSLYRQLTSDEEPDSAGTDDMTTTLVTLDAEGNEISSNDISSKLQSIYPQYSAWDAEGNIYLYSQIWEEVSGEYQNTDNIMTLINASSLETESIHLEEHSEIAGMTCTKNGKLTAVIYDDEGNCSVKTWDKEKKSFTGDKDNTISAMWTQDIYPADENHFYYTCDGTLYDYNLTEKKDEKLLKFLDWNISADNISGICYIDEEHMLIISENYTEEETTIVLNKLTRVKASELAQKTEITLGCLYANQQIENAVVDFNRTSSDYKIVIRDYSADSDADYDEIINSFHNDILSGDGPDLIDLSSLDYSRYAESGLFEDLYPYMKADAEFSGKNLNQNVLKLLEQNGALYALPSTYVISGLVSAKSLLGDSELTIDKFAEIIANNTDKEILGYSSRETVLSLLLAYNKDYFIDYGNKTCNFTDGTFEKLLNIAKSFPAREEIDSSFDENEYISDEQKISEGRLLFYQMNLNDPNEYQIPDILFHNDFNITGYPAAEGNRIAASITSNLFAINAKSKHKEDCWTFIKLLFEQSDEWGSYNGFPLDNDKLDEYLKRLATPNMVTDENGNQVEEPSTYGFGDFELQLYALTDEQVQKIKELAASVSALSPSDYSGDLFDIVNEESAAFFSGEKSAADVCSVIQSRVNIVINESNGV